MAEVFTSAAMNTWFILSEANGQRSRENGTLKEGENLVAGTVLAADGAELVAYVDGDEAVGILLYNVDATDAAQAVSYIARDAEVNLKLLQYGQAEEPSAGATEADEVVAALAAIGIRARD